MRYGKISNNGIAIRYIVAVRHGIASHTATLFLFVFFFGFCFEPKAKNNANENANAKAKAKKAKAEKQINKKSKKSKAKKQKRKKPRVYRDCVVYRWFYRQCMHPMGGRLAGSFFSLCFMYCFCFSQRCCAAPDSSSGTYARRSATPPACSGGE
jgi:hypothetical protein